MTTATVWYGVGGPGVVKQRGGRDITPVLVLSFLNVDR